MSTAVVTKGGVLFYVVMVCCFCVIGGAAQTSSRAKSQHTKEASQKQHKKSDHSLPYPFLGVKAMRVTLPPQQNGNQEATVLIDLEEYWRLATPYKDQQRLAKRPFTEYIQYVHDHVGPHMSKPATKGK